MCDFLVLCETRVMGTWQMKKHLEGAYNQMQAQGKYISRNQCFLGRMFALNFSLSIQLGYQMPILQLNLQAAGTYSSEPSLRFWKINHRVAGAE